MNKFRFTINGLAIAMFIFAFASFAQAQATRTWVSGVGDDANPCSRTAPCKTWAGAISKTACDGEIDALDPGGFGAVTITKSITLDGQGTLASILAAGTNGINVNISSPCGSNWVQIRNLTINGAGTGLTGINIVGGSGTTVSIEDCVIFNFRAGNGRGISDGRNTAGKLYVQDTLLKNNSGDGLKIEGVGPIKASLDNVRSVSNGALGIHITQATNFLAARNTLANLNLTGFAADGGAKMDLINCMSAYNGTGVNSDSGSDVVLARTTVTRNTVNGLGFSGGTIKSYGNNEVANNTGSNGPFTAGGTPLQ